MQKHARDFVSAGIPFVFDPGQGLPMFSGDELLEFIKLADYACFNDYEAKLLCDRTARSLEELASSVKALIVTRGSEGSHIHANGQRYDIPCVKADHVIDPTGCGDAYRSGLLYGITAGWDWEKTGRLAAVMGAIKIAHRGGQNHRPTREEIAERYSRAFGSAPW
jgi:adenosine kinase